MNDLLGELNRFLGKASSVTYAGGGPEVEAQRLGHTELEYREGDWLYRDSYAGHYQSWGQELIWYKKKPFWTQVYGGGMSGKLQSDGNLAREAFQFLKLSLLQGEKVNLFQPRGPKDYQQQNWAYSCDWAGNIQKFRGSEEITYKKEVVFTHDFMGGIFIAK